MSDKNLPTPKTENNEEIEFYFKDEENLLNDSIKEIDDLYDEIKEHYDEVKKSSRTANGGRGVLSFVEKQTANLVSLKNSKANLINNKISLKKIAIELALKQKKDMDDTQVNNDIVNAVLNKLDEMEGNSTIVDVIDSSDSDEDSSKQSTDDDSLLESRLAELIEAGEIESDEEETKEDSEDEGVLAVRVHNKKWSFVGINELGKIIKGFPVPNKKEYKMKLRKDEEHGQIAVDQNGRIYKVIKK